MVVKFTARTVEALRPTHGARAEYFDATLPGLALRITERGVKTWSVVYRHRGRLRRLTLGRTHVLSLADARDRARAALAQVLSGQDPAGAKQAARRAVSIADLVSEYIDRHARPFKRSWKEDQRRLTKYVLPTWRHRAVADIQRHDVHAVLDAIVAAGARVEANRVLAVIRKMFSFARDRELVAINPAAGVARPGGREVSRARVLSAGELRTLWAEAAVLSLEMRAFFQLRLLTLQRGGEVTAMRWCDVDLVAGWWTIPAGVAKNGLAHRVPIAPATATLLRELRAAAVDGVEYVLAGARGKRQQSAAAATFSVEDFRGHDLRRTAASHLASGGFSRDVIARVLNHAERGVTAVYDRHSYDREKRAALDWWDRALAALLQDEGGKVVPFAYAG